VQVAPPERSITIEPLIAFDEATTTETAALCENDAPLSKSVPPADDPCCASVPVAESVPLTLSESVPE
jgi:hypothetical protein